jgi:hypothetical protein
VVGYSVDLDHNSKGVLRFVLKNPFWETLEKRVSTETYKGVLSSFVLGTKGRLGLKQKQVEPDAVPSGFDISSLPSSLQLRHDLPLLSETRLSLAALYIANRNASQLDSQRFNFATSVFK